MNTKLFFKHTLSPLQPFSNIFIFICRKFNLPPLCFEGMNKIVFKLWHFLKYASYDIITPILTCWVCCILLFNILKHYRGGESEMRMEINILLPTNLVKWTHTKYIIDTSAAGCIATTLRDVDEYTSPGLNRIPIIC